MKISRKLRHAVLVATVIGLGLIPTAGRGQTTGRIGAQVDATDSDRYVNAFLKQCVAQGNVRCAGTGAWWGPPDLFSQNQLWTVIRKAEPGKVYPPNSAIPVEVTCLMPGKLPGKGTAKNTLGFPSILYNLGNNPEQTSPAGPGNLEQWHSMTRFGFSNGSIEQRARCKTFEEQANPFDEPNAPSHRGDEVRNNFNSMIWFGDLVQDAEPDQTKTANHLALPTTRTDLMDGHAWYGGGVEYAYSIPENAADLMGSTVSGTIHLRGWAAACKKPNCEHTTEPIEVHHHAAKIEINDKDYWLEQHVHSPDQNPLPPEYREKNLVSFALDTTQLTNGWHILTHHMHVIDKRDIPGFRNKQLASEIKFAINVNNAGPPAPPPQANEVFLASADYSSSQGYRRWSYLDSNGLSMTYQVDPYQAWMGVESYNLVTASLQHPGNNADSIRRWTAPQAGIARITGTIRDQDFCGTDGVNVAIAKGSEQLWSAAIANGETAGVSHDVSIATASGDAINFIVNKGRDNSCDATLWDPKIVFTPSN